MKYSHVAMLTAVHFPGKNISLKSMEVDNVLDWAANLNSVTE